MHDLYNQLANVESELNRRSQKRQTNTATLGGLGFNPLIRRRNYTPSKSLHKLPARIFTEKTHARITIIGRVKFK